ncbi:hypothetical protein C8R47DRAFT_1206737 [Mycena vitilis]|nr:hypothetical protein C8R47DRAFT_1206737 [Mycena vitilis]
MHLQPEVNLTDAPQSYASTSRHMESPQVPAGFGTEQPRPQFVNPPHTTGLPFPNLGPSAGAHHSSRVPDLMGDSDGNFAAEASSDSDEESSDSEPQYRSPRMKSAVPLFGASTTRTVLDMPLRGSRDAPKLFRGHHSEVEYFIAHYDRLLVKFHVTDPEDQCKLILDYCGTDVQGFIRASKYYHQRKWPKLRHEILQSYDVDRATSRYKPSDIASYTLRTKSKPFQNLSQWKKYYRKYKTMAGTLLHQGHITPLNYDVYFWLGIEPDLRRTLEQRINQLNPGRNVYRQYSVREIHTAAEWYFRRNRAEAMVVNAADYGVDLDSGTTDAESEEESEDSDDSDYEAYRRKHRAKARAKKEKERKNKKKSSTAPATSSKTRTLQTAGTAEEVTSLIRQLNRMSITDPEYAPVYYKVLTLDSTGVAARCVQAPRIAQPWTDANKGFNKGAPAKPPVTSTTGSSTAAVAPAPLTYPNNIPLGAPPPPGCYGCGIDGHRIGECPEIQDLLTKNIIAVDPETRRLRMKDGTFIRRSQGESLAQAARRITAPRVMFSAAEHNKLHDARDMKAVMASLAYVEDYLTSTDTSDTECGADVIYTDQELDAHWYVTKNDISDTESGGEQGEVYLTVPEPPANLNSEENDVNAAERTMPSSKAARKEIFDGVMLPRRDRLKNDPTPVKAAAAPKETPRGKKDEAPRQVRDLLPELTPVDARQPREDIDMPDLDLTSRGGGISQSGKGPTKEHGDHSAVKRQDDSSSKNTGRYSDIQSTVQIPSIIDRILDLTIPMTVREAFVSSKEIRTGILDCIKLRNVKAVLLGNGQENPLVAQWNWPRTEGVLIKIDVESRGHLISAIIDTGSQLDVVRADVAALKIQRPVDMTYVTNMNDANGGKGQLRGYIHDAEFNCGGVLTSTDLWVSHQAPFELLLGRPWQRGNMVTIDEREEGTYLVFKDRDTRQPRYELLAIPYEALRGMPLDLGIPTSHMLIVEPKRTVQNAQQCVDLFRNSDRLKQENSQEEITLMEQHSPVHVARSPNHPQERDEMRLANPHLKSQPAPAKTIRLTAEGRMGGNISRTADRSEPGLMEMLIRLLVPRSSGAHHLRNRHSADPTPPGTHSVREKLESPAWTRTAELMNNNKLRTWKQPFEFNQHPPSTALRGQLLLEPAATGLDHAQLTIGSVKRLGWSSKNILTSALYNFATQVMLFLLLQTWWGSLQVGWTRFEAGLGPERTTPADKLPRPDKEGSMLHQNAAPPPFPDDNLTRASFLPAGNAGLAPTRWLALGKRMLTLVWNSGRGVLIPSPSRVAVKQAPPRDFRIRSKKSYQTRKATRKRSVATPRKMDWNLQRQKGLKWSLGLAAVGICLGILSGAFRAEKKQQPNWEVQAIRSPKTNKKYRGDYAPHSFTLETLPARNLAHILLSHSLTFPVMPNYYRPYRPGSGRHITSPSPPTTPNANSSQPRAEAEERREFPSPLLSMPSAVLNRHRDHYYGTVDTHPSGGTIHQRIRAATDIPWGQHRRGLPLTVRPGSVVSPQTSYTGVETRPSGQEVHHAVLLNARLLIHNPITGRPGMRNGHAIVHFFAAPVTDRAWDLETPFVGADEVTEALPRYCASVHREVGLQRRPGEFVLTANRQIERAPTPFPGARRVQPAGPRPAPSAPRPASSVPRPAPPVKKTTGHPISGIPRPIPVYTPARRPPVKKEEPFRYFTYPKGDPPRLRARNAQETGLVDADTGMEVLALPTRAHPTLPADPRPDTPRPPRRLYEQRPRLAIKRAASDPDLDEQMEDVQPKKARTETKKDDLPDRLASLNRWSTSNVRAEKLNAALAKAALLQRLQDADEATGPAAKAQSLPDIEILEDGGDAESTSSSSESSPCRHIAMAHYNVPTRTVGSESSPTSDEEDELESEDDDLSELEYVDVPHEDSMVVDAEVQNADIQVRSVASDIQRKPEEMEDVDAVGSDDAMEESEEELLGELGAQPPFAESSPPVDDSPVPMAPRLRTDLPLPDPNAAGPDDAAPRPSSLSSTSSSSLSSPAPSEPFTLLSPIDNVPSLTSNFVALVPPAFARPGPLVDNSARPPPSLLFSSSESGTLPSLVSAGSVLSPDAFNFRHQQEVSGSYFTTASTVATDGGSPFESYRFSHRSPSGYAEVDQHEFDRQLATIRTQPAHAFVDLNERTMDIVRTRLMAQDHEAFLARQRDAENARMLVVLKRVHAVATRAGPFLDQLAMKLREKVDIDVHTYRVKRGESAEEKQDRADEDRDVAGILATLATDAGDGTLRTRDDLGLPVSADGTHVRFLSCTAMLNGPMYRLVLRVLLLQHLEIVAILVEFRELMLEFIFVARQIMKERRESYDITLLHQLAHLPPPYLHGYEYARLRILQYMFKRGGDITVVNSIEELLRLRFCKWTILTHFLNAGMFEGNDAIRRGDECALSLSLAFSRS